MPKPPRSTPHSDIDGVHQDEERSTDVAAERGDDAAALQQARDGNAARPTYEDQKENLDDRTG